MHAIRPDTPLLFFDLAEIAEFSNVHRVVVPADKHRGNPILPRGDVGEWDSRRAGPWASRSVIYDHDERLFKMWYSGYPTAAGRAATRPQRTGYAVSDDGLIWEKPRLGLFEFDGDGRANDSRANNICVENIGSVIKDEAEADPERRYKLFCKKPAGIPDAMGVAYSADGIRWGTPVAIPVDIWGGRRYDTVAFIRDDQDPDESRRYKLLWQELTESSKPGGPPRVRDKHLAFGGTELEWRPSRYNPIIDPNDGREQEIHFLAYVPYRGQYLLLYEFGWYHPDGTGRYGRYAADIRIAHSRDGERFTRIRDDQQLIRRGALGDWDDGFLVIGDKIVVKDDTIYLYYAGQDRSWTSWPPQNAPDGQRVRAGATRHTETGVATLAIDRFTALETRDSEAPGHALTVPLALPAAPCRMVANVSSAEPRRSWCCIDLLDEAGRLLDGFAGRPLVTDVVDGPVIWPGGDLARLAGRTVRLRVRLCGRARLHSLTVQSL